MKKFQILLFACMIGVSACEIDSSEEPIVIDAPEKNEVRAILEGRLVGPKGKLKSVDLYQPDESGIHFRTDYYYNEDGNLILSLGIYEEGTYGPPIYSIGDTTGASINIYTRGKLTEKRSFDFNKGNFTYRNSVFNTYDNQGRLFQIFYSEEYLGVTHYYNEKGLLEFKKYGENQEREIDEFQYDEQDRISRHIHWGGEAPIFDHYFRYDSQSRLEAKETWNGPEDKEDVFKFSYNEDGQLTQELEFYPQWGFVPRFKRIFSYYN